MSAPLSLKQPQFDGRLFTLDRASPVALTAVTAPRMRAEGNPHHGHVVKVSEVNGFIHFRYSRCVNRQRSRENKAPDFMAMPRAWGQRVKGTPLVALVTADGITQLYLEVKIQRRTWVFREPDTGEQIPQSELQEFLLPPAKAYTQQLDRDVVMRDYRTDHIAELRVDGETWRNRKAWNLFERLTNSLFAGAGVSSSQA